MAVTRDSWDVLAKVYGVESGAESIGAVIADRIGALGPANRIEVVGIVSALVGNRIVRSGKSIKNDPIVQWCKEGHGLGVLLPLSARISAPSLLHRFESSLVALEGRIDMIFRPCNPFFLFSRWH